MKFPRRDFVKKIGLVAGGTMLAPEFALAHGTEGIYSQKMTNSGAFIIENAEILTMDDELGTFSNASIAVNNGKIVEIGEQISVIEGAEIIDGKNAIVMPGLIDCHWHLWTSLLRSMSGNEKGEGYFPMTAAFSKVYTPKHMQLAARYAAAEAINAGITTISDFNHNARSPEYVLASCKALAEAGLRAEVQYGGYRDRDPQEPTPFSAIKEVLEEINQQELYNNVNLGLGSRGAGYSDLAKDWARARSLGMRITIHASSNAQQVGQIMTLQEKGLLGPDVNIIHANYITAPEVEAVKAAESSITMTPLSEMRIGYGFPPVKQLYNNKINTALGVDTTSLTGSADLFEIMKVILNVGNAQAESEFFLPHKEVLKMATINAARTLGVDNKTGSLKPGKSADLIMLRKNNLNFSASDIAENLVVEAASPQNVELVCVEGKFLKKQGKLTTVNAEAIIEEAAAATKELMEKKG